MCGLLSGMLNCDRPGFSGAVRSTQIGEASSGFDNSSVQRIFGGIIEVSLELFEREIEVDHEISNPDC
ncbi:hypothetical protein WJ40_00845 [Burkholderia cepacia]|nr:hypothetical protein WJ40_00845 [Burkholderia cepacia]